MKLSNQLLTAAAAVAVAAVVLAAPALADDTSSWINPLSSGANSLASSLVNIAAPVMGLSIGAFGIWSVLTHRVDWHRLWMFLMGGTLIGVGPQFATWFMGLFPKVTGG